MKWSFDAIVIGAGQSGPPLAARFAQAGMSVALIEREHLGGTCVNDGCIPTKTLVASARVAQVARQAANFGVRVGGEVSVDMRAVKARKDAVVNQSVAALTAFIESVEVPEYHTGALFVNGKLAETLTVGTHAFWRVGRNLRVSIVDTRLQTLEVSGQEILSKDKVSLRLNLMAAYRVTDALLAASKLSDIEGFLYKELQFGLRAAVGTRTLDELLEDKGVIDTVVGEYIRQRIGGYGLEVDSVGVKDIILPGEMKLILSKVVEAEKVAQANVIRRREETAATRSLLNTAKVMEDNPTALRLKELETLEKVTEKIDKISVFGGLEGLLKDLVKIRP